MSHFSHRKYFRRYKLNVEQYGEILVAQAFQGKKMGDAQRGYDIGVSKKHFKEALQKAGADVKQIRRFLPKPDEEIRIEVKSKLMPTSEATVVHCGRTKFEGKRLKDGIKPGMTHLAIVIVLPGGCASGANHSQEKDEEGLIDNAWLITRDRAHKLLRKHTKDKYIISPQEVKHAAGNRGIIDIKTLLRKAARANCVKPT